jgi:tRNA A37 threonylcarbamoyladenosine dehydratase
MFVRAGIGTLTLVDPDTFSEENLARHELTRKDIGKSKVLGLVNYLKGINPDCKVMFLFQKFNVSSVYYSKPDLFVSAVDSYECESMINAYTLKHNIPALYVGCWGEASVGEIYYVLQ